MKRPLTIAVLRIQHSTAELAAMDGRQLFSDGVETGRIGSSTPTDADLGAVRITDDRAYIRVVADGTATPVDLRLVHADGAWLVDVVAAIHVVNSVMEDGAQQAGLPENQLIFEAVESVTGVDVQRSGALVDAVDRAFVDAGPVHHVDAGLADDVGHA